MSHLSCPFANWQRHGLDEFEDNADLASCILISPPAPQRKKVNITSTNLTHAAPQGRNSSHNYEQHSNQYFHVWQRKPQNKSVTPRPDNALRDGWAYSSVDQTDSCLTDIDVDESFPSDDEEDRTPDPAKENERSLMLEEAILSLGSWC
jgi:hypothetical protein